MSEQGGTGKNIWRVHSFCHTAFTMTVEFLKKETGGFWKASCMTGNPH